MLHQQYSNFDVHCDKSKLCILVYMLPSVNIFNGLIYLHYLEIVFVRRGAIPKVN